MNILYKYCNQSGILKILESLELKLPYISETNDPLENSPFLYCENNVEKSKRICLSTFKRRNVTPPINWEEKLKEQIENGEYQAKLIDGFRKLEKEWNQEKTCLLSVSKTAQNTVMWAHYSDKHKGAVIGIDFNQIFPDYGIEMSPVNYCEQRPKMNVLDYSANELLGKKIIEIVLTKSADWKYEQEFRTVFLVDDLINLEQRGLACLKDFNGKETWFLRITSKSIKVVLFGLYIEESLKLTIKNLISQSELQHVKLYQVVRSENYTFNLVELVRQ